MKEWEGGWTRGGGVCGSQATRTSRRVQLRDWSVALSMPDECWRISGASHHHWGVLLAKTGPWPKAPGHIERGLPRGSNRLACVVHTMGQ
jgi:hypothetical protein